MIKEVEKEKKNTLFIFILFTVISFSLHYFQELSLLKYFFKIFETFQHEIGHGYVSMLLGGSVESLHLEYNQGHVMHRTADWAKPFVSFAGYFSASLFGFLMYASSLYISKYIKILLVINTLFWFLFVDGLMTSGILLIILSVFILSWYLKEVGGYLLRFIGIYIMVSSIYSPTYLWAYSESGDHVSLASQTGIPSFFWIIIWFVIGLFFLYRALKLSLKNKSKKEIKI